MWLYPLPSLIALAGWTFLLSTSAMDVLSLLFIVYGSGLFVYILRDQFLPQRGSTSQ
jgi:hypothetical protein